MKTDEVTGIRLSVAGAVALLLLAQSAAAIATGAKRPSDHGVRTCLESFRETDEDDQIRCLARLREAGPASAAVTRHLADILERSDGNTDDVLVASVLDVFRSAGVRASPAAETLGRLLAHRSKIYKGRDKVLVVRLRAYIVLTLSDIGSPSSALIALFDTLAHLDARMTAIEVGSCARAAGSLGARGRDFVPYLLEALVDRPSAEEFSLERYDPQFPPEEATTVQLEAVRALARVSSAEDPQVVTVLARISRDPAGTHDPRLVREAQKALDLIGGLDPLARGE